MSRERVQERGGRGEEAVSAAKELSDISNQTETRHLRHPCKTTRKQDYYFISFLVDYTLLGFDLLSWRFYSFWFALFYLQMGGRNICRGTEN